MLIETSSEMDEKLRTLLRKLFRNECTAEEIDFLRAHLGSDNKERFEKLVEEDGLQIEELKVDSELKHEVFEKIKARINRKQEFSRPGKFRFGKRILKYAAVLVGIGLMSFFFYNQFSDSQITRSEITIELNDGTIKTINAEEIQISDDTKINLEEGTRLIYETSDEMPVKELEYNTIRIPFGKKLQVELSDGSLVYLNAGSSLKYPISFVKGKEREVFLKGEAFFEVTHNEEDKFVVNASGVKTEVLGTKFNVHAYPEDKFSQITLLEGSVSVKADRTPEGTVLIPNEMAVFKEDAFSEVKKVNALDQIAWIDGVLLFDNEPFETILPKLERRYDVEIINNYDQLNKRHFTGRFKTEDINDVLSIFSKARPFEHKKEKRKVYIYK